MTEGWRHAKLAVQWLIVAAGLAACASPPPPPPKPTVIQATIETRPTSNPDARGRPSPVVLRFYEL